MMVMASSAIVRAFATAHASARAAVCTQPITAPDALRASPSPQNKPQPALRTPLGPMLLPSVATSPPPLTASSAPKVAPDSAGTRAKRPATRCNGLRMRQRSQEPILFASTSCLAHLIPTHDARCPHTCRDTARHSSDGTLPQCMCLYAIMLANIAAPSGLEVLKRHIFQRTLLH